jgi:HSP20 family protein
MNTQLSKTNDTTTTRTEAAYRRPYYTVKGDKEGYTVSVFMPGVSRDDHSISVDRDELLVEGRKAVDSLEGGRYLHREIHTESYKLRLQLNVSVDPERIEAKSENGVLHIRLPLAQEAKPRTIEIS